MGDPPRPKASAASFVLRALLSAMMILVGLVLLLPGMCAGFFLIAPLLQHDLAAANFFAPWIIYGFVISAGGVLLIVIAVRLLRSGRN